MSAWFVCVFYLSYFSYSLLWFVVCVDCWLFVVVIWLSVVVCRLLLVVVVVVFLLCVACGYCLWLSVVLAACYNSVSIVVCCCMISISA